MKKLSLWILLGIASVGSGILLRSSAQPQTCRWTSSLYRDVANKGFELKFQPSEPPASATATVSHPKRGILFEFDVIESQGYTVRNMVYKDQPESSQPLYFFDTNLMPPQSEESPIYAFVAGLGYADWSVNQEKGAREIILGDSMWKFSSCQ
jgi:hypothetical protein